MYSLYNIVCLGVPRIHANTVLNDDRVHMWQVHSWSCVSSNSVGCLYTCITNPTNSWNAWSSFTGRTIPPMQTVLHQYQLWWYRIDIVIVDTLCVATPFRDWSSFSTLRCEPHWTKFVERFWPGVGTTIGAKIAMVVQWLCCSPLAMGFVSLLQVCYEERE